jgi:hypothetical protein
MSVWNKFRDMYFSAAGIVAQVLQPGGRRMRPQFDTILEEGAGFVGRLTPVGEAGRQGALWGETDGNGNLVVH